jgi:hypothetical protein
MLSKSQFWILTTLAAVGLVLIVTNMVVFAQNRQAQAEISQRAQYIQQSAQLEPLYRDLIKALADLSLRNHDDQLREVLSKSGIKLPPNPSPPVPAGAPATQAGKGGK